MYRACIAVVDAARARLFTFERRSEPAGVTEQLVEQHDLVDLARRRRPSELFSDSRPGSSRTGNLQYAFDDHRETHLAAFDAEFAAAIAAQLRGMLHATQAKRLIVCASPKMLGELRAATGDLLHEGLEVDEVPRDLVKLTPPQLRAQLEAYGLLPAKAP